MAELERELAAAAVVLVPVAEVLVEQPRRRQPAERIVVARVGAVEQQREPVGSDRARELRVQRAAARAGDRRVGRDREQSAAAGRVHELPAAAADDAAEILRRERHVARAAGVVDVAGAQLDRVVAPERRLGAAADGARRVAGRVELVRQHDLARVERLVERQRDLDEVQLARRVLDRVVDPARKRRLRDHRAAARVDRREQHHLGTDDDVRAQRDAVGKAARCEDAPVVADVVARGEERRAAVVAAEIELRARDELVEAAQRVRLAAGARAELAPLRGRAPGVEPREEVVARERVVAARARVAGGRVRAVVRIAVVRAQRAAVLRRALQRVGRVVRKRRERLADGAGAEHRDAPAARVRPVGIAVAAARDAGHGARARAHEPVDERPAQVRRKEEARFARHVGAVGAQHDRARREAGDELHQRGAVAVERDVERLAAHGVGDDAGRRRRERNRARGAVGSGRRARGCGIRNALEPRVALHEHDLHDGPRCRVMPPRVASLDAHLIGARAVRAERTDARHAEARGTAGAEHAVDRRRAAHAARRRAASARPCSGPAAVRRRSRCSACRRSSNRRCACRCARTESRRRRPSARRPRP